MSWDDDKSDAADPDNPTADEQLTAQEWDDHVTQGHFPADELNLGVDGGDPVLTDPQNGDQVVMRYDRSSGSWVIDALKTDSATLGDTYKTAFSQSEFDNLTLNAGDNIRLGKFNLSATTISTNVNLEGSSYGGGTNLGGDLTLDANATCVSKIATGNYDIIVNQNASQLLQISLGSSKNIDIDADSVLVSQIVGAGNITYFSGTTDGEVGIIDGRISITDNGSNSIL